MDVLARLAALVDDLADRGLEERVLVAVDGPDAAGKTTLADRLATAVRTRSIRVSVDDFLRPRALRYQRGGLSPEGYYRDSFNGGALVERCLRLFASGIRMITTALSAEDRRAAHPAVRLEPGPAVLVVDGCSCTGLSCGSGGRCRSTCGCPRR